MSSMTRTMPGPRPFARNPLDVIVQEHALQLDLCDALERIADGLPDEVDRRLCAKVASFLQYELPLHHQDEEEGLFPLLLARASEGDGIGEIIDRLAAEHVTDTDLAAEIFETLDTLSQGGRVSNPDMVGYMLRNFFEGYRRHVHWENALVIPLARLRLTDDDFAALSARMDENRAKSG